MLEKLYAIPEKEKCIIIVTGNYVYVGEGFNYPRLDTLFLFDQDDFLKVLKKDMNDARLSITIASPTLKKTRTISMLNYLIGLNLKSENIIVITRPASDYKSAEAEIVKELLHQLTISGFSVDLRPNSHQKFVVVDEQIVWYGTVTLLAYGRRPETMLRFVNKEVASEIVGSAEKELATDPKPSDST